jgi:UDP-N-acetylmuramoyl-L-alanyl-D-glutamate--2,6-diaminopimelate ligase
VETTSQALAEGFCNQWRPHVGVFTNLSRDHLDVHKTPENYLAAKAQLFLSLREGGAAVLNAADPASALLAEVTAPGVRVFAYAARPVHPDAAHLPLLLCADTIAVTRDGTRITLVKTPLGEALGGELALRVVGDVHAENALAAAVAADALGYDPGAITRGLSAFEGVPGRFQEVAARPLVVVDFAHTPDALERTLSLARSIASADGGRVVCVFGCGGDRDPGKRPLMGRVAARLADVVVITTDNPRSEEPARIAEAVLEGTRGSSTRVERILERAEAIQSAITMAAAVDVVVIAGKGHEKTQIVGTSVVAFDDVAIARLALG